MYIRSGAFAPTTSGAILSISLCLMPCPVRTFSRRITARGSQERAGRGRPRRARPFFSRSSPAPTDAVMTTSKMASSECPAAFRAWICGSVMLAALCATFTAKEPSAPGGGLPGEDRAAKSGIRIAR